MKKKKRHLLPSFGAAERHDTRARVAPTSPFFLLVQSLRLLLFCVFFFFFFPFFLLLFALQTLCCVLCVWGAFKSRHFSRNSLSSGKGPLFSLLKEISSLSLPFFFKEDENKKKTTIKLIFWPAVFNKKAKKERKKIPDCCLVSAYQ